MFLEIKCNSFMIALNLLTRAGQICIDLKGGNFYFDAKSAVNRVDPRQVERIQERMRILPFIYLSSMPSLTVAWIGLGIVE